MFGLSLGDVDHRAGLPAPPPDERHPVGTKRPIYGHDLKVVVLRLGENQPIEEVSVVPGQRFHLLVVEGEIVGMIVLDPPVRLNDGRGRHVPLRASPRTGADFIRSATSEGRMGPHGSGAMTSRTYCRLVV